MKYENTILKILGPFTDRDGEVAERILSYVAKNPDWYMQEKTQEHNSATLVAIDNSLTEIYGKPLSYYLERKRDSDRVRVRCLVCYFLRENTPLSLISVGHIMGLHHATVIHACKQAEAGMKIYPSVKNEYQTLKNCILSKL